MDDVARQSASLRVTPKGFSTQCATVCARLQVVEIIEEKKIKKFLAHPSIQVTMLTVTGSCPAGIAKRGQAKPACIVL
jgi:hypothetical protein